MEELPNSSVVHKQNPYILFYKKTTPNVFKPQQQAQPVPEKVQTPPATRGGRGRGRGRGGRGAAQSPQTKPANEPSTPSSPPTPQAPEVEASPAPMKAPEEVVSATPKPNATFYLNVGDSDAECRMEIVMKLGLSLDVC